MQDRHYFWGLQVSSNLILTSSLWNVATENAIINDSGWEHFVDIALLLRSTKARRCVIL